MAPEGVIEDEAEPKGITRALWGVWLIVLQSIYLLACGEFFDGRIQHFASMRFAGGLSGKEEDSVSRSPLNILMPLHTP
jgi:hypothetical protein